MRDFYKILVIDLENSKKIIEKVDKNISDFYLGGYGLGLWWLNKNKDIKDAFMIFTSAINNFSNPINKYIIMAKDKNKIACGNMGGDFSDYLKGNDYDALVLVNKASKLSEIFIDGENIIINYGKIKEDNSNSAIFNDLRNSYGNDISSKYISQSSINNDNISRLIADSYRGISKDMANILYQKNIKSISIKRNDIREIKEYPKDLLKLTTSCPGCISGCKEKRNHKKESIFSIKKNQSKEEKQKLKNICEKIDQYGIDLFALSKSIVYAYDKLNDIYKFNPYDINQLEDIVDNIISPDRKEIYADLAKGSKFLASKYKMEPNDNKKNSKSDSYLKIIDSACLCFFSVDASDLSNICQLINKISNSDYKESDLLDLQKEIKKMEKSLG